MTPLPSFMPGLCALDAAAWRHRGPWYWVRRGDRRGVHAREPGRVGVQPDRRGDEHAGPHPGLTRRPQGGGSRHSIMCRVLIVSVSFQDILRSPA